MVRSHYFSLLLSFAIHLPFLYGFQFSFTHHPPQIFPKFQETFITYQSKNTFKAEVKKGEIAPRSGYQVRSPKEAIFSKAKSFSRKVQAKAVKISSNRSRSSVRVEKVDLEKATRKFLVPTVENLELKTPQVKKIFFEYYDVIRKKIEVHTLYPYHAKLGGAEGEAYLSFVLQKSGKVNEIVLLETSGYGLLDVAAMNSVRNAEPFPPFPSILGEENIKLNVPISFELD